MDAVNKKEEEEEEEKEEVDELSLFGESDGSCVHCIVSIIVDLSVTITLNARKRTDVSMRFSDRERSGGHNIASYTSRGSGCSLHPFFCFYECLLVTTYKMCTAKNV